MLKKKRKLTLAEAAELAERGELGAVLDEMGVPPAEIPIGQDEPWSRSNALDLHTFDRKQYERDFFKK